MLLHTSPHSGILSIFPGVPAEWSDAAFHLLRASGGLTVSAKRVAGATQFVRLQSMLPRNVTFTIPGDIAWAQSIPPLSLPTKRVYSGPEAGDWTVTLSAGDAVILYVLPAGPPFTIEPLPGNKSEFHFFGFTRPMQPLH